LDAKEHVKPYPLKKKHIATPKTGRPNVDVRLYFSRKGMNSFIV
jgi:hypothetical protein